MKFDQLTPCHPNHFLLLSFSLHLAKNPLQKRRNWKRGVCLFFSFLFFYWKRILAAKVAGHFFLLATTLPHAHKHTHTHTHTHKRKDRERFRDKKRKKILGIINKLESNQCLPKHLFSYLDELTHKQFWKESLKAWTSVYKDFFCWLSLLMINFMHRRLSF